MLLAGIKITNKLIGRRGVLWPVVLLFTAAAYAKVSATFEDPQQCQAYPVECLEEISRILPSTQVHSLDWYRLKQNQLKALFQLQSNDLLNQELPALVVLDDAPPVFLTTAYTIYAKLLLVKGNEQEGRKHVDKAVNLIKAVNEVSIDPTRYAEVSNLYTYTKDWQAAKEFGLWAQSKLANIKNLVATASFHTSQGHVYSKLNDHKQAEFHYSLALKGYLQKGNAIHTSVGHHNLARTYQKTQRHELAIKHFRQAIKWSDKLGKHYDAIGKGHTLMRLTQSYIQTNQLANAQATFALVNPDIMPDYFADTYAQVHGELIQASQHDDD